MLRPRRHNAGELGHVEGAVRAHDHLTLPFPLALSSTATTTAAALITAAESAASPATAAAATTTVSTAADADRDGSTPPPVVIHVLAEVLESIAHRGQLGQEERVHPGQIETVEPVRIHRDCQPAVGASVSHVDDLYGRREQRG